MSYAAWAGAAASSASAMRARVEIRIARPYGRRDGSLLPGRKGPVSASLPDADLRACLGGRRQPQEGTEHVHAGAPGDHRLRSHLGAGHDVEPALVLVAREVADQLPVDRHSDRVRVVRVVGLPNEERDLL